jgi:LEA14-like dessication related protein
MKNIGMRYFAFFWKHLCGQPGRPGTRHGYSLLACLLLAVLAGCTSLDSDFETPTVTINSFRAIPSESGTPSFEIGLRVVNPNRDALELQGVAYTISLEGRELVTGVGKDLPIIPGYSEGIFTVTASASLFQGFRLITDLMSTPKDKLSYEVSTKLDVGTFRPAIRVKDTGEISLLPSAN